MHAFPGGLFDGLIKLSFNFFSFNEFIQIKIAHYPKAYAGTKNLHVELRY
jgi:hypothetical protein